MPLLTRARLLHAATYAQDATVRHLGFVYIRRTEVLMVLFLPSILFLQCYAFELMSLILLVRSQTASEGNTPKVQSLQNHLGAN